MCGLAGSGAAIAPELRALAPVPAKHAVAQSRDLLLVGERPADRDQDREVDDANGVRVEVAELLADLAIDLERRHRRPDEAQLEERLLRRDVRSGRTARQTA